VSANLAARDSFCFVVVDVTEHLRESDVTIDEHVRRKQIALGQTLAERRAVYLDTKFWILFRDAEKTVGTAEADELLSLLRDGVLD
jgi:hypothetical protein